MVSEGNEAEPGVRALYVGHSMPLECRPKPGALGDAWADTTNPTAGSCSPRSAAWQMSRPAERMAAFYNQRGTAEQHIKVGKNAATWTRLSCRRFAANAVRLQLQALAYNVAELPADAGAAGRGGAVVDDDAARAVGEDRR